MRLLQKPCLHRAPCPLVPLRAQNRPVFRCVHRQLKQHVRIINCAVSPAVGDQAAHHEAPDPDTTSQSEPVETQLTPSQARLNDFLVWLVANDVQGIGLNDSSVGLYEDGDERGLMSLKAIKKGQVVLRVPLRLAITDHAQDEESNRLMYEDAPWSVRLATKLLREQAKGESSPWCPYLRVLPSKVPAPLEVFSWEDMQQVEWPPAQAAIYEYNWLVSDAYQRASGQGMDQDQLDMITEQIEALAVSGDEVVAQVHLSKGPAAPESTQPTSSSGSSDDEHAVHQSGPASPSPSPEPFEQEEEEEVSWMVPEAAGLGSPAPTPDQIQQVLGGADAADFQWAMSVVHSRTFANASPDGGVGVRMLVPLIDMLNHAGDVTASGTIDDTQLLAQDNVRWDVISPERSPQSCWEMAVSATQDVAAGAPLLLSYGDRASDDFFLYYGFVPPLCNPHEDVVVFEDGSEAMEWHREQYASQLAPHMSEELYSRAYSALVQEQRLTAWNVKADRGAKAAAAAAAGGPGGGSGSEEGSPAPPASSSSATSGGKSGAQLPQGWQKLKVYAGGRVDSALITAFSLAASGDVSAAELAVARRAKQLLLAMPTPVLQDLLLLHQEAAARGDTQERERLAGLMLHQARIQREYDAALNSEVAAAVAAATGGVSEAAGRGGSMDEGDSSAGSAATEVFTCPAADSLDSLLVELEQAGEALRASGQLQLAVPLTANQLLCVRFRAGKKLVLWGVLHKAYCAHKRAAPPLVSSSLPRRMDRRQVAGWGGKSRLADLSDLIGNIQLERKDE